MEPSACARCTSRYAAIRDLTSVSRTSRWPSLSGNAAMAGRMGHLHKHHLFTRRYTSDVTGAGCVTDLGSGEELCGADAKRFCTELAKQRRAERRVERHDFLEQRRLERMTARDAEAAADASEEAGVAGAQILRRTARNARRDASKPFRPRPPDPADLESARVCRAAATGD